MSRCAQTGAVRYSTWRDAKNAWVAIAAKNPDQPGTHPTGKFRCRHCDGIHLAYPNPLKKATR